MFINEKIIRKVLVEMKKIGLVLFVGILLIGFLQFSSASCLEEILSNEATQLTATVNSTSTQLEFYLDTEGISCDTLDVVELIEDFDLDLNQLGLNHTKLEFSLSDVLEDFNFSVNYREDVDSLEFSKIQVSGEIFILYEDGLTIEWGTTSLINTLFNWAKSKDYLDKTYRIQDIMLNTSIMDEILSPYTEGMPEMFGNANLVKQGNDWTLSYDQGFNDLQTEHEDWFNTTINAIKNNESFEKNINEYMQEKFSWAKDIPYLSEGGDLVVKVMPGELKVINNSVIMAGSYSVPLTFTFDEGTPVTKSTRLVLTENIIIEETEEDLEEGEQTATNETTTVEANTTTLIFDTTSINVSEIIIPTTIESNKTISLDMSSLLTLSGGVNVTVPNEIVLERDTSSFDYQVTIPASTTITGATSGWDGVLDLPTVTTLTTSLGEVNTIVEMGDSTIKLNFNKAIKVVLSGMTGKKALWADSTGSYNIALCDSTASSTSEGTLTSGECYLDNGVDLIIWTFHFTKFGAYTPTVAEEEEETIRHHHYASSSDSDAIDLSQQTPKSSSIPFNPGINLNQNKGGIGITGAFIGALTNPLFWLAINVTILLGILLVFLSRKKKKISQILEKDKENETIEEKVEEETPLIEEIKKEKPKSKKAKKKSSKKKKKTQAKKE